MGIFSYFARKCVATFPTYEHAPSSSSALSSNSDSTDSENVDPPVVPLLVESPPISRPCLKSFECNGIKHYGTKDDGTVTLSLISDQSHDILKPNNRVRFASSLEQVFLVENYSNDPCLRLELWSNRMDYMCRNRKDVAVVRNAKSRSLDMNRSKNRRRPIEEQEYLSAFATAYHQFCLTGTVDKSLQNFILLGIECGYRTLERLTSDNQVRREFSRRIRQSTVHLYKSLIQESATGSKRTSRRDKNNIDIYLRTHMESLNCYHVRWALFIGRLDRMAARRCMNSTKDNAAIQSYRTVTEQSRPQESFSVLNDDGATKICLCVPSGLVLPVHDDVVTLGLEAAVVLC